ncbi:hypothetical protein NCCP2222_18760 [Sporosarcina sp. NCCP-2222]|uniref:diguanylate cyclase domain-containing protein n=1 Tax=Sporosarcina sp. NCCP-2222 TaxID=2935073 RepID=UPI00207DAAD4|nr:diguanylate cyclase [Sporosarcina sp. NCCP-2222]GKV55929.1 hypothetical protein NCCP2222_18760 [Sporosarcina sp. NCCP-2222]
MTETDNQLLNRILFEGIKEMVMVIGVRDNEELYYEYINRAAMERTWLTAEAIGRPLREVESPEKFEFFRLNHLHVIHTKREFHYEDSYEMENGEMYYSSVRLVPMLNEEGQVTHIVIHAHDMTAMKKAERDLAKSQEKLHETEDQFRIIANHSRDLIVILDIYGKVEYISPSCTEALGFSEEEIMARPFPYFIHPEDRSGLVNAFTDSLRKQRHFKVKFRMRNKWNEWIWFEIYGSPVFNEQHRINRIVAIARDISVDKRSEEQLRYFAYHDMLSDLWNRRAFYEHLADALQREQYRREGLALLLLDIDRFKWINDQNGHDIGDQVIAEFSKRLKGAVRRMDTVARFGGDEFAVLLPSVGSREDAYAVAESIQRAIAKPWVFTDRCLLVTTSIGLAVAEGNMTDDELIKQADLALYEAKESGRNCCIG